jgi:hypothetical protein
VTKSRIREWSGWLLKEAILTPVAAWIGAGVLALLSPAILLLAAKGVAFFVTPHQIPGWAISGAFGLALLAILLAVYALTRVRALAARWQPRPVKVFRCFGLDWVLGPDFWGSYEYSSVVELSPLVLRSSIRSPLCPECKRDVTREFSDYISYPPGGPNGCCGGCGLIFEPANAPWSEVDSARRDVYLKAQAAARRNEL